MINMHSLHEQLEHFSHDWVIAGWQSHYSYEISNSVNITSYIAPEQNSSVISISFCILK